MAADANNDSVVFQQQIDGQSLIHKIVGCGSHGVFGIDLKHLYQV